MKKVLLFFAFVFSSLGIFADLYKPHRIFEIGADVQAEFSNSAFRPSDVLQKDLVIDLQRLNKRMPSDGLTFTVFSKQQVFLNTNFSSRSRWSFFTGTEETGFINFDKSIFDFLANGISIDDKKEFKLTGYFDAYYEAGFSYQTLVGNFGFKIKPCYFVPLVYMPVTTAKATVKTSSSGRIEMKTTAPLEIYTVIDAKKAKENYSNPMELRDDIIFGAGHGGFDLELEIERNILEGLNVSAFGRIPVLPATMCNMMTADFNASFFETGALSILEEKEDHEFESNFDNIEYKEAAYRVRRPVVVGLQGSYRPWGAWLTIKPKFDIVIRDIFKESCFVYGEYDLNAEVKFKEMLGINLGTGFLNRAFVHKLGFMINLRLVEINARVALCSNDLLNSFQLSGASGYVGFRIGL